jgi:O-antigen ligase
VAPLLVAAMVSWTLFAFGGYYAWTQWPAAAAVGAAVLLVRPPIGARPYRWLDASLIAASAYVFAQILPLPAGWLAVLSPHVRAVDAAIRFQSDPHRSMSLDPPATLKAAFITALLLLTFWVCRAMFAERGLRRVIRAVAWSGLVVSIVAIVCRAVAPTLLYATWDPGDSARPYGPFIDRNHMGSWLVMATPLVIGYLAGRLGRDGRTLAAKIDARTLWLAAAAVAMYAASILSFSRSTLAGMAAAVVTGGLLTVKQGGRRAAAALTMVAALACLIAYEMPLTSELVRRIEHPGGQPQWSRLQIWHDTIPMIRDFALTGVGIGGYRNAMVVYQQADRRLFFNQAHNQFLQFAAEGGAVLGVAIVTALVAFGVLVRRRLATADAWPGYCVRAGALAGIAGISVQSFWEIGLRMPANGALFAVLCAVAIHEPRRQQLGGPV